ncbi:MULTISPECIES: MFS transporter [Asticcacaulis]|uniref:MFS transporter n=1 Tax=Asticcacaulis TaxID=76890 RepID=UPI001AE2584C|nr:MULTISPECIES: MFS transporter [Asticcacaulis]MBP2161009.1 GPH family glycoside/pentoside/hexuronide:cation symporter [Asticcacaulis solisilvae]MDR6802054.1 GPH family glycoside/pentoside/hexuronide:cation symporter [Asticcacaulis sp. BE141]
MAERRPAGISLKGAAVYGLGDFACNLYWQSVSLFLLFYYTEVAGLSPATAGLIYLVASVWDGVIDPLIGMAADRTRTRFGAYRPYLLIGGPLLGLSFCLLYYRPPLEGYALAIFMLVSHLIFRTVYALVNIPYAALSGRITADPDRRAQLSGFRMFFGALAAALVSLAIPFTNGEGRGYFLLAVGFAAVATLLFPLVFAVTREPETGPTAAPPPKLKALLWSLMRNRAFWALNLGVIAFAVSGTTLTKSVLYYFKYQLHDEAAGALCLAATGVAGLVVIPFWTLLARRLGRRGVWIAASLVGLSGLLALAVLPAVGTGWTTALLVWVHSGFLGLFFAFWSLLPDTVDYGEQATHVRADGFVFGVAGMISKVSVGIGAALFGWGLSVSGYRPNIDQTTETLAGLKTLMVLPPIAGLSICVVLMILTVRARK